MDVQLQFANHFFSILPFIILSLVLWGVIRLFVVLPKGLLKYWLAVTIISVLYSYTNQYGHRLVINTESQSAPLIYGMEKKSSTKAQTDEERLQQNQDMYNSNK